MAAGRAGAPRGDGAELALDGRVRGAVQPDRVHEPGQADRAGQQPAPEEQVRRGRGCSNLLQKSKNWKNPGKLIMKLFY